MRDTRLVRLRLPLIAALLVALVAAGAVAALASGGGPAEPKGTGARAAVAPAEEADALPPLPKARPKVVEPVAGEATEAEEDVAVASDPSDDGSDDVKPTRAASTKRLQGRALSSSSGNAVSDATALPNGVALPPLEAPDEVLRIIEAGNSIAKTPYKWGGGHGKWQDTGYDCSGSVSFALASAGLLAGPMASGPFMKWGKPGKGKWITIYTNPGHMFMEVAGIRFDTSGARITGSRWQNAKRSTGGFVARHPPGL